MKSVKLLSLAALLALLACAAGCEQGETLRTDSSAGTSPGAVLSSYCFEGYRYLVYSEYHAGGLTQMWEDGPEGPRPMRCQKEQAND